MIIDHHYTEPICMCDLNGSECEESEGTGEPPDCENCPKRKAYEEKVKA